jgi:hypothetical protein
MITAIKTEVAGHYLSSMFLLGRRRYLVINQLENEYLV